MVSLKHIAEVIPNPSNQPFQADWGTFLLLYASKGI